MNTTFTITNSTKGKLPRLPFLEIKNAVLGKKYDLSLVFIGERRSRNLNVAYRQKNKSTNVLSFPLDKTCGEIFITPSVARRQMKNFDRSFPNFIAFLFIHGLCHLAGMDHGSIMEKAERKICTRFRI